MTLSALIRKREVGDPAPRVVEADTTTASRWWLIQYADREPVEASILPEATHAEVMSIYPEAIAAEPFFEVMPLSTGP